MRYAGFPGAHLTDLLHAPISGRRHCGKAALQGPEQIMGLGTPKLCCPEGRDVTRDAPLDGPPVASRSDRILLNVQRGYRALMSAS
jgi:hypothetical protein